MVELSDKEIAQYFQRSFTAVDGLWFMKVEGRHGFDEALETDCEVWKVLPKIQARTMKALTGLDHGLHALFECLTTRLTLEGFVFTTAWESERAFKIMISGCPWYDMMIRAGREALAGKVGTGICKTEHAVWASEFDRESSVEMSSFRCGGDDYCQVTFRGADHENTFETV